MLFLNIERESEKKSRKKSWKHKSNSLVNRTKIQITTPYQIRHAACVQLVRKWQKKSSSSVIAICLERLLSSYNFLLILFNWFVHRSRLVCSQYWLQNPTTTKNIHSHVRINIVLTNIFLLFPGDFVFFFVPFIFCIEIESQIVRK